MWKHENKILQLKKEYFKWGMRKDFLHLANQHFWKFWSEMLWTYLLSIMHKTYPWKPMCIWPVGHLTMAKSSVMKKHYIPWSAKEYVLFFIDQFSKTL